MFVLLVMLLHGLCVFSTSVKEKSRFVGFVFTFNVPRKTLDEYVELVKQLAYFPNQNQLNMDHVEGPAEDRRQI